MHDAQQALLSPQRIRNTTDLGLYFCFSEGRVYGRITAHAGRLGRSLRHTWCSPPTCRISWTDSEPSPCWGFWPWRALCRSGWDYRASHTDTCRRCSSDTALQRTRKRKRTLELTKGALPPPTGIKNKANSRTKAVLLWWYCRIWGKIRRDSRS